MSMKQQNNLDSILTNDLKVRGIQVKPFFYSFINDSDSKPNIVKFRHELPLLVSVVVERKLNDDQLVVSSDDASLSLPLKQKHFRDLFDEVRPESAHSEDLIDGHDFLFKTEDSEVYRVRLLKKVSDSTVNVRLLDFNVYDFVNTKSLYKMTSEFVEGLDKFAFVARVNLPPRSLTQQMNLPDGKLIQAGDRIELIVLTAVEPHLVVFGFSYSSSHCIQFDQMTDGLSDEDKSNWIELLRGSKLDPTAITLPMGYGRLQKRDRHENRLAVAVAVEGLDAVHVRDLESCARLSMLKQRLQELYTNKRLSQALAFQDIDELNSGMGCVAENPTNNLFYRVEVVDLAKGIYVQAVDYPDLPPFQVSIDEVFRPIAALKFARQFFTVSMTRHSKSILRYHLTQLTSCLIPNGTPIILETNPSSGLTTIISSNAMEGVLEAIGFDKLGEGADECYNTTTKVMMGFGEEPLIQPRAPEMLMSVVE
ncbi:hypothetical protein M3Y94_01059400 [Aphelenchoides besseyi]|nr:hypothetical protein M3Y94_01059400 [Aphelenchoides besseyi]KAI6224168.1 hypothetical protein M3Y95_00854500 [Aphelenchoides besseyi]